ncbi:BamA/TamA family outer membrane protein [Sphingobacterium sp. BN32]|uniref:translocation and assembly module lipoprotein TamL n=1 Tax=Sphingobacterium sp. BN32 TaxID=3058432 RepID=UPI00265D082E|nr:BamA/TamA family outer membrane protein [Sphingobacterium sp. BN32]WKK57314.1 BamA/TamA family outer membrane protein [Sphingobacterium sp. BN32]
MTKKRSILFFASITFLLLFFASCRSAKYLEDQQALVTDIDINGVTPELKENTQMYIANEIRPNSPLYLTIYNLFNTKDGRYKTERIKNVGEAPRILDSAMVELSATQIQRYLQTKGYFNASVTPSISIHKKKAQIDFNAVLGTPYLINEIDRTVSDPKVRELYESKVLPKSTIQRGKQYDAADFYAERENMYTQMRENGYYDYLRQYMRVGLDTLGKSFSTDIRLQISDPSDSTKHQIYTIDEVHFRIEAPEEGLKRNETAQFDSLTKISFTDETERFKLRPLARYAYLRRGQVYNSDNEELSYDRLYETNGFRSVKINYEKKDSSKLDVYYNLIPRAAMSNQIEGEFTFSSGMSGFNIGNTFSHRNVFGGSETIEVKLRYGVLFDTRLPGNLADKIFNNDLQFGVNLSFPRLLTPFGVRSVGRYGIPRTTFSSSLQLFFQDQTYANRYWINSLNYMWYQSSNSLHSLTPVVIEYRDGHLNEAFRQQLLEEGYQLYVESNHRQYFGLGAQYAYTFNSPKLTRKETFNYFRGGVDVSGNLLGLLGNVVNFKQNESGEKLIFGVPFLQYIKGEVDYRWYKYLGGNKQFVFRFNSGVAVPYGNNSRLMIFEKSFFAGGMNGIRAWQARTLGPGGYNREVVREELRVNLRNLDQLGEIKIESNAEYRFRLLNNFFGAKLNGATFVDAGNIWNLRENNINLDGEFKFNKFLSQIAIGTGFGLRVDMDYFIIRLDAGLKVKDPQFKGKEQWVIRRLFNASEFKQVYYDAHKPDRYNFMQYNFGVGMPF